MDRIIYKKINYLDLDKILKYYNSKKIVVGHTFVKKISSDYNGKIIRTDVHHGSKKFSNKTEGLLVENGKEFVVDANSSKKPLQ